MKIRPVEAELFYGAKQRDRETDRQADGWTDTAKLLVPTDNFVNSP
jgi:hypothetical protein